MHSIVLIYAIYCMNNYRISKQALWDILELWD
jgi:hypothetical protein